MKFIIGASTVNQQNSASAGIGIAWCKASYRNNLKAQQILQTTSILGIYWSFQATSP